MDGLSIKGAQPGMALSRVTELLGDCLSQEAQGSDHLHGFADDIAALVRGEQVTSLYSKRVDSQSETNFLVAGDSREVVHQRLGVPTDPGMMSSQRPPHYEGYDAPGRRLMVNYRGDEVVRFVFSAR